MNRVKYIFSINTGRSGSDYLTRLLAQAKNTVSLHEAFPIMNGQPMQLYNDGKAKSLNELMPLKLQEIKKKSRRNAIYCETNHSFIKGWGFLLPDQYIPQEEMGVIILKRPTEEVISSLLRVHDLPGSNTFNKTWYLSPNLQQNMIPYSGSSNPYDLCEWYIQEVNARTEAFINKFPLIRYYESDLQSLNDFEKVNDLFHFYHLRPKESLKDVCGKRLNVRNEWPKQSLEYYSKFNYPSAINLEPDAVAHLLPQVIAYIFKNYQMNLESLEPDMTMGGSLILSTTNFIALIESELENEFKFDLKYSELESFLILELLYSLNPYDFVFVFANRHVQPHLYYLFDFNIIPDLKTVYMKLGIKGIFNLLKVIIFATGVEITVIEIQTQ